MPGLIQQQSSHNHPSRSLSPLSCHLNYQIPAYLYPHPPLYPLLIFLEVMVRGSDIRDHSRRLNTHLRPWLEGHL